MRRLIKRVGSHETLNGLVLTHFFSWKHQNFALKVSVMLNTRFKRSLGTKCALGLKVSELHDQLIAYTV